MFGSLVKRLTPRSRLLLIANLLVVAWGCGSSHPLRPSALTPEILPLRQTASPGTGPKRKEGTA